MSLFFHGVCYTALRVARGGDLTDFFVDKISFLAYNCNTNKYKINIFYYKEILYYGRTGIGAV